MSFEPIGLATIVIGLFCLPLGYAVTMAVFVVLTMMGSAAAILIGGANISPAHLFLLFVAAATLAWRRLAGTAVLALAPPRAGFWLACLVLYGAINGFLSPRLLAERSQIITLGTSQYTVDSQGLVPLGPVSSNLTQTIYLIGDLMCFLLTIAVGSTRKGFEALGKALAAYALVNIGFAVLDVVTSATGTQDLLKFMRNAQYTFHDEESVGNMRRIVGSWPEASGFAGVTLGALGFTGTMWLCGRNPLGHGVLALGSLAAILLSTSSTGLVGSAFVSVIHYVTALTRCGTHHRDRFSSATVLLFPLIACAALVVLLIDDALRSRLLDYLDLLVLSKATTASGVQRASWNAFALKNFFDSWGLGVGLGTNRTSSFPLAVLSNVGVPGAIFYSLFAVTSFAGARRRSRSLVSDTQLAARNGCLALLGGSLVAGPTVDQGLLFYVLAGMACAAPVMAEESRTASLAPRRPHPAPELPAVSAHQAQSPPQRLRRAPSAGS